jgi:hypothetical protein
MIFSTGGKHGARRMQATAVSSARKEPARANPEGSGEREKPHSIPALARMM